MTFPKPVNGDDEFLRPRIGAPLMELLTKSIPAMEPVHELVPPGMTPLGDAAKAGKSTLAEQIAFDVSLDNPVLLLALEYNLPTVQARFERFGPSNDIHMIMEGEIKRFGEGGEKGFSELLTTANPRLVVVDLLTKLKRPGADYQDECRAFSELKEVCSTNGADCLALHHTIKSTAHESDDPVEMFLGSTALAGVPDNLMLMRKSGNLTKLLTKGRLIPRSEKTYAFSYGIYAERADAGAVIEGKAPVQADILNLLKQGPLRHNAIVKALGKDPGQISKAFNTLFREGRINRDNRTAPWQLTPEATSSANTNPNSRAKRIT